MSANKKRDEISTVFNCFPISKETIREMQKYEHRTIQENVTRFCRDWLKILGEEYDPRFTDARNKDGVAFARKLMSIPEAREVFDNPLPYV